MCACDAWAHRTGFFSPQRPSADAEDVDVADSAAAPGAVDDADDLADSSIAPCAHYDADAAPSPEKSEIHTATHEIKQTQANDLFRPWMQKLNVKTHLMCLYMFGILCFDIL